MNIFSNLKVYAENFKVNSERAFTQEEIDCVAQAVVVSSQFGNSCCFMFKSGGQSYIPMARDAKAGLGEVIDLTKAKIVTLTRTGQTIERIYA